MNAISKKLSIIVPVYNVEKYVSKCLDSIIAQDYPNFEIIIVDDGSTDSGGKICDQYADKYPQQCKVYHIPNGGLSNARNFGMSKACGYYIGYVDSDDYIEPSMYSKLIGELENKDAQISFCMFNEIQLDGRKIVYEEGALTLLEKNPRNQFPLFEQYPWKKEGAKKKSNSMLKCVWRAVYLFDVIKQHSMQFSVQARWGEDALFLTEYLMYCKRCAYVKEPLYNYTIRMGSLVNQYKNEFLEVRKYLYGKESKLILANEIHTSREKRYLINELKLINCLAIVMNEISDKKNGYARLVAIEKDPFFSNLMTWECVKQSMACNRPIKHLAFAFLVKLHAWKLIIALYKK